MEKNLIQLVSTLFLWHPDKKLNAIKAGLSFVLGRGSVGFRLMRLKFTESTLRLRAVPGVLPLHNERINLLGENVWFPGVCADEPVSALCCQNSGALTDRRWKSEMISLRATRAIWAFGCYFNQNKVLVNMQIEPFNNCWSQFLSGCRSELKREIWGRKCNS